MPNIVPGSEIWAEVEANEIRLWLMEGERGLWCPECLKPSGYTFAIVRDPADKPTTWIWRCADHVIEETQ